MGLVRHNGNGFVALRPHKAAEHFEQQVNRSFTQGDSILAHEQGQEVPGEYHLAKWEGETDKKGVQDRK